MPHWLPAVIFGAIVAVFGGAMLRRNMQAWRDVAHDDELNSFDMTHFRNRYARRVQLSGMLLIIGVMIAIGDVAVWNLGPGPAAVFWLLVILLGCWTALLALGDLTAVHTHSQVVRKRVEQQRQMLEKELADLQRGTRRDENQ